MLDQRAKDVGVAGIESLADMVPLLFAHMTYKSYPESFLQKGQWDRMNLWLDTLDAKRVEGVDVEGIADVDDWLVRLEAVGHHVRASSGTGGKSSFLDWTDVDRARHRSFGIDTLVRSTGLPTERTHPVFVFAPLRGFHRTADGAQVIIHVYGRPDAIYALFDSPPSVGEVNRMGAIRKAMAEGTVSPHDLEEAQRRAAEQEATTAATLTRMVDAILEHRGEQIVMRGGWAQLYRIMQIARDKGVGDGELCPGSTVITGGGRKAVVFEGDFERDVERFFAGTNFVNNFGMSEINLPFPQCREGRFHIPAQVVPILLDESGERLAPAGGPGASGRFACFDFTLDCRWGGVITSDNVDIHFDRCSCGSPSTSLSSVNRFGNVAGVDDKLTCAGTIEAYVRGIVAPTL